MTIQVEELSKRFYIRHQHSPRYDTLRETIMNNMRSFFSSTGTINTQPEEFWALKDISFTVDRGDRIGIIGRNGAGKSTLFKVMSRITPPTNGRVKIRGRVASLLEVGT